MLWIAVATAHAGTVDVYDADGLWDALDHVAPGDDVVVHAGVYETQLPSGSWLREVVLPGTEGAPITLRAAAEENVIIEGDPAGSQNIVNLSGDWFTLSGFELRFGSKGIRMFETTNANIENLIIHDVGDVGISANDPGAVYEALWFAGIEIYNTGIDGGTGECFYLGCQADACQVMGSYVELNWCHDTQMGSQGDGIEIKSGSYGNTVRDNVIHDVNYPGITIYGTRGRGINRVERNVVWNSLTQGIQVVGEALVMNNIVFDTASYGLFSKSSDGQDPLDLGILNNTVVNGSGTCFRANDWADATDITVVNNAFFCDSGTGVEISGEPGTSVWAGNAVTGANGAPTGTFDGKSVTVAFEDAAAHDYYPSADSPLVDAGDDVKSQGTSTASIGIRVPTMSGAYERRDDDNPGWHVGDGFKACLSSPDDTGGHHGDDDGGGDDGGGDDGGGDDSTPTTDDSTVADDSTAATDDEGAPDDGCGCGSGSTPTLAAWVLAALLTSRRRT